MKCSQRTTLRLWMHFSSGSQQRKVSFLNRSAVFMASSLPYILLISALSERTIKRVSTSQSCYWMLKDLVLTWAWRVSLTPYMKLSVQVRPALMAHTVVLWSVPWCTSLCRHPFRPLCLWMKGKLIYVSSPNQLQVRISLTLSQRDNFKNTYVWMWSKYIPLCSGFIFASFFFFPPEEYYMTLLIKLSL